MAKDSFYIASDPYRPVRGCKGFFCYLERNVKVPIELAHLARCDRCNDEDLILLSPNSAIVEARHEARKRGYVVAKVPGQGWTVICPACQDKLKGSEYGEETSGER